MKSRQNLFIISSLLILLVLAVSAPAQQAETSVSMKPVGEEAFAVMSRFFDYDRSMPLDARTVARQETPEYLREKIVFRSTGDKRVPGYLAIPKNGKAPFPVALLLHGIGSSKESWWQDDSFQTGGLLTKNLLASGIAVLTLDAEYHGERLAYNDFESPTVFTFEKGWMMRARDMIVQTAIDHRRALDYLATRGDIDIARTGMIGYSMGGMIALQLTALDPRIKASVASVSPILKEPGSALAVYNFAPYFKNTPFLLLAGKTDTMNYTVEEAQKLVELVPGSSKEISFYESGHKLPLEWTNRASEWMKKELEKNFSVK